jgi:hypothetical protein
MDLNPDSLKSKFETVLFARMRNGDLLIDSEHKRHEPAYQGLRETWPHAGALRDCGSCPEQCLKKKKCHKDKSKKNI